ncbi:MAG: histidine phosphatase family protein [Pseudomonadales bacterium]|nr:histidine phosphatase family protein [Pseudomonadales bacterium]
MSELILVRHGQASFGAQSYDKLSPLGEEQVQLLARHWQEGAEHFDHLYCGELQRQRETAELLRPLVRSGAHAHVHPGLNEYDGDGLMRLYLHHHHDAGEAVTLPIADRREFQRLFEAAVALWVSGRLQTQDDENFEPWVSFKARVHGAIDELMARHTGGSRVLVATSGGVIALALQRVLGIPDEQTIATNWLVNNSAVTRIRYGGGRVSLSQFNSLPHLEGPALRDKITYR